MKRWDLINKLIDLHPEINSILEIGVLRGENASHILVKHPNLKYVGVDPYEMENPCKSYRPDRDYLQAKTELAHYENAEIFKLTSEQYFKHHDEMFDLIFIDGDHSYEAVAKDIAMSLPRLKGPRILCGHDYSSWHPEVKSAVDESLLNDSRTDVDNTWIHYA
jgi:predicted O-methyltransferase YrrM